MNTYPNLITEVCKTEKTIELVSNAIPVLIRWAQSGITTNTYGDLSQELGRPRNFRYIGEVLGKVETVLRCLRKDLAQKDIPTLNALVNKTGKTDLPSSGFVFVSKGYEKLPIELKKVVTEAYNQKAIEYQNWDLVLQALCLKPSVAMSEKDEKSIRCGKYSRGGESPQHKALKEYIFTHPDSIEVRNVVKSDTEFILLSGDRLDVYFEQKDGSRIAVEVKSKISDDADILRGLYQCVKYKSILDAENKTHGVFDSTRSVLVIEGSLSESNRQVKNSLGIKVIEGFFTE